MSLRGVIEKKNIEGIISIEETQHYLILWIDKEKVNDIIGILKNDPDLAFNWLSFITAIDRKIYLEIVYFLYSTELSHRICLKAKLPRKNANVPSIYKHFVGATWHENEIFDFFGIYFEGHPFPRRLFTTPDIEGHPLLKDFFAPHIILSGGEPRKPDKFKMRD
ncbi:MAG: NADH-quinone oxidoreductase subunit C [bacterium]